MEFFESLNLLDIFIIITTVIISLFAAVKGLMKNIVQLILMIFAIVLAGILAQKIQTAYINNFITDQNTAYIVSFIAVLLGAYLIIFGVMKIFFKNNQEKEGIMNTVIAFLIAFIRYSFVWALICSTLSSFDAIKDKSVWENSQLASVLAKTGDYAYNTKVRMQETNLKDYVPKEVAGG